MRPVDSKSRGDDDLIDLVRKWQKARGLSDAEMLDEQIGYMYILANKRVQQRFFSRSGTKLVNPAPGHVVEAAVTATDRYEFFLIPHAGPVGVQGPVRYEVIANHGLEESVDPKDLYDLTYGLSFGFFNFHAAIKLPAPLMYAQCQLAFNAKVFERRDGLATPAGFTSKLHYI